MHSTTNMRHQWIILMSVLLVSSMSLCAEEVFDLTVSKSQIALKKPVTYSCTSKPIEEVLMNLADLAGIDIVKSPEVTGNVTVKITDVPLEEALSNILGAHNYTYVATENMVRVIPVPETAALEKPLITRVYQIRYSDANGVAAALQGFVSPGGSVAMSRETNHIMVTDIPEKISGIDKFIESINETISQVLVEVRIYDVMSREGFELEPNWYLGRNTPLETIERWDSTPLTRTDVTTYDDYEGDAALSGDDAIVTLAPGETVAYLPSDLRTFSTSGSIIETRTEDILNPDGYNKVKTTSEMRKRKPFVSGSFDRETGGTLSFSLLNDAIDLELALSILHSQVEAKLLANPRILVLDNETANFEIVREFPYRELRQVAREDPITYTAFKKIGVNLQVTPHIAPGGMIKLRVAPEFGVLVGENLQGAPIVDTRKADTMALVEDGQTIVLGGLRTRETTKDISKVPVFGDMPILGGLFKAETESLKTSELVIFITTKIVHKPEMTEQESRRLEESKFVMPDMKKLRLEAGQEQKKLMPVEKDFEKVETDDISSVLRQLLEKMER